MHAHSQFCMSGDYTLEATDASIKELAQEEADEHFLVVLSDANLERYGIRPERFANVLTSDPEVNAFVIFIGSLGDQAERWAGGMGNGCSDENHKLEGKADEKWYQRNMFQQRGDVFKLMMIWGLFLEALVFGSSLLPSQLDLLPNVSHPFLNSFFFSFRLQKTLPAGRTFVVMDTQKIPQTLQQIFTSTVLWRRYRRPTTCSVCTDVCHNSHSQWARSGREVSEYVSVYGSLCWLRGSAGRWSHQSGRVRPSLTEIISDNPASVQPRWGNPHMGDELLRGHLVCLGFIYWHCLIIHSCVNIIPKTNLYTGQGVFAPVLKRFGFGLIFLIALESQLRNSYNHTLIVADIADDLLGSGKVKIGEITALC